MDARAKGKIENVAKIARQRRASRETRERDKKKTAHEARGWLSTMANSVWSRDSSLGTYTKISPKMFHRLCRFL